MQTIIFINNSFYIATSGTTGDSQLVNIDTDKFFNSIRNIHNDSDKWLLTYNPKLLCWSSGYFDGSNE